jgi:dTDP-4-amino-4,6-dideoxygalactose transaminase|tara:strand:- start:753 stop:1889 length:1137 start_codon:yes stop_codon:yes gene_type:complete
LIKFNKAPVTGKEIEYIANALAKVDRKLSGDGEYGKKCQEWFDSNYPDSKTLLTPSCTQSLELAALLIGIKEGDEVIMPSYTFVSTANAFVLRGAKIVFVDIRKDTMNIDEKKIEEAITKKTKAIVPVHYAGVACEMDTIMSLAEKYNLYVIEDAAQGMMANYKGKALGTIGHFGAFSFHETKNYTSGGEGGLLLINNPDYFERAEIIREKGTNRSQFFRGAVDKYTWVDIGSSYLPSEIQSAYLWAQLECAELINQDRIDTWNFYFKSLENLSNQGYIELPSVPHNCEHNGHMFYFKTQSLDVRTKLIKFLRSKGVSAVFHYVPLHSSPAGKVFGEFSSEDKYTTLESEKLLRLPLWYGMKSAEQQLVVQAVKDFFS